MKQQNEINTDAVFAVDYIEFTARVQVEDCTVKHFEEARIKCGAPSEAQIRISNTFSTGLTIPVRGARRPVEVEFTWTT